MSRYVKLAISLAITVGCFWWTFKDTNVDDMLAALKSANYVWILPYLGLLAVIHVARTLRWGALLSGIEKVPFRKLNEASGIGFMMLIILPFRLGEFARPFLIAQRGKNIRRSAAMTSVVLERIVDGIIIAVMLRALLFFVDSDAPALVRINWGANLMFAVFGGGLAFLLFARWQHQRAVALIRATAGRVSPKLGEKIAYMTDGFVGALRQLPDGKNFALFFFWTAVYWVVNGLGMALMAKAFAASGLELTPFQGFVVLSVLIIGMMIPAAPGSAGTYQAFVVLALSLFHSKEVVSASGVAYANVIWVVQILQQCVYGLILLVASHQSFTDIAGKLGGGDEEPPSNKPSQPGASADPEAKEVPT